MKYIDADLLRKELERRITDNTFGAKLELIDIIAWLDSLQQEQMDFPTTDEEVEKFLATHPKVELPEKYKTPDWLFKKQEQQEVDSRSIPVLRADTTEKQDRILEIIGQDEIYCHFSLDFGKETDCGYEDYNDRIYIDGNLTFNKMAEIVDFLSKNSK